MNCINCGCSLKNTDKFCPKCGTKVEITLNELKAKELICPKCGKKLRENSTFCSNCGQNLNEELSEDKAERLIKKYFTNTKEFGYRLFCFVDPTFEKNLDEMNRLKIKLEKNEKPLLLFSYNNKNDGFLVTNKRFIAEYVFTASPERCICKLDELKSADHEKKLLNNIMYIEANNTFYEIQLSAMSKAERFVELFDMFIEDYNDKSSNMKINTSDNSDKPAEDIDKIITRAVIGYKSDDYNIIGDPFVSSTHKKYNAAKINFEIPDDDYIYVICDGTTFGSCKKGLAICSSGIYYKRSKLEHLSWEEVKKSDIKPLLIQGLNINGCELDITNPKKIVKIINNIKRSI